MEGKTEVKSLTERAMLVTLSIHQWGGRVKDKRVTDEAIAENDAQAGAGAFTKSLINQGVLKEMNMAANELRREFKHLTLPWGELGQRLLLTHGYWDFQKKISDKRQPILDKWEQFFGRYEVLREQARLELGRMFDPKNYPTLENLRRRYHIDMDISPIATADDWRVGLADDESERIRQEISTSVLNNLDAAQGEAVQRIFDVVSKFATIMHDPAAKFQASTVSNILRVCEVLPSLNVRQDHSLDAIITKTLETVAGYSPDVLRDDPKVRSMAAFEATQLVEEIESEMGFYLTTE